MNKPNLIFIVSDQHRGDWMGCAGNRLVHTPNMDRMAEGGIQFTQAYCNSPLCVPSRMSLLTGQYPHHNDVFSNSDTLRSDVPTLAHALGIAGYDTILGGRMHFVGPDQRHGFQQRLVGDITHCYHGGPKTDYGELQGSSGQGLKSIITAGPGHSPVLEYDEQVVVSCEQLLSDRANAQSGPQGHTPLFLTVGLYGPHHPYVCPQSYYDKARAAMEAADSLLPADEQPLHPWFDEWFERLKAHQISSEQLKVARACYAGLISLTDSYVGRILDAASQLPGDTWVVYVSDHGDMAGDRGMFWKRNMLEGAIRVPMLWYPLQQEETGRKLGKGIKVEVPASLLDLSPTFTSIAEAPELPQQDGRDLLPLLIGAETSEMDKWKQSPVFVELANKHDGIIRAVIRNGIKLVYFAGYDTHLLFDLNCDPQETVDLWSSHDYEAVRDDLMRQILSDDWNSQQIGESIHAREANIRYLTKWGSQVGMGLSDLWSHPENFPRNN
jgi:choline-sulfatase